MRRRKSLEYNTKGRSRLFLSESARPFAVSFSPTGGMTELIVTDNTTQALVASAQAGNREAFQELVARYETRLREIVELRMGRQVRGKTELDDLMQETFLRAWESVSHFEWRHESGLLRWFVSIAENRIRDTVKGPRGREVLELHDQSPAENPSASRVARRDERFDRLKGALGHLSPHHREVIRLSRLEGLKIREVAQRMNRSETAVKNLLLRALRDLKSSFGDTESLHLPDRRIVSDGFNEHEL